MKYYKLTKENENHHGFQYKDGLNTDILEFDPQGTCEPGGLYFSDAEHILENLFLNHYYIREVTLPNNEEIYKDPSSYKYKSHSIILGKRRDLNELSTWEWMIKERIDVHTNDEWALKWAVINGHLEVVKYLVENGANIHADNELALKWAANNGHLEVVKYLVENGADIHVDNEWALRWAANNGHLDVVKYLVENGADIHVDIDYALRWAVINGNLDIVRYLKSIK